MTEWFEQWFGEEYLRLYPHRDEADASAAVALIQRWRPLAGQRVLDLACGPGRHARQMSAAGARVLGFDLSMPLLARARLHAGTAVRLVRGDMRALPFHESSFDVVVNLFTSFGYFSDDEQHRTVLREVRRVVTDQGAFVIDYFNAIAVRQALVPREERVVGSQRVVIERRVTDDGRFVMKELSLTGEGRRFIERVRLFDPAELENLLRDGGFRVMRRAGDYDGSPMSAQSPRAVLLAVPA